jgi:hypothetical protein
LSKKKKVIPAIIKEIRQRTFLPLEYTYQKSISFSQLSVFRSCPRKWSLQYKDGHYTSEQSIHMTFGTALHETLQHYITTLYEVSGAEADRIDIETYFEDKMGEIYRKNYEDNKKVHFSNPSELREFYNDGVEIIKFIKKKKNNYFSKTGWHLVGCEIPIQLTPNPTYKNTIYKGYLDLVLYHEPTNKIKIVDIKTSTRGWSDLNKKDEDKQFQLILYKQYFSQLYNLPVDNIEVEFFIVKRKVPETSDFPIKRVQIFSPASGKVKLNKATSAVKEFVEEVFNVDGTHKDKSYAPQPSKHNCSFCPFKDKKELCDKGLTL